MTDARERARRGAAHGAAAPKAAERACSQPLLPERSPSLLGRQMQMDKLRSQIGVGTPAATQAQISPAFSKFMGGVIIASALRLGAECQWTAAQYPMLGQAYLALDAIFLVLFTLEVVIKLVALRLAYFRSSWNIVDFVITVTSALELWAVFNHQSTFVRRARLLRTARSLRLIRLIRIVKSVPELVMVVDGIAMAMKSLGWVMLLMVTVVYMFA